MLEECVYVFAIVWRIWRGSEAPNMRKWSVSMSLILVSCWFCSRGDCSCLMWSTATDSGCKSRARENPHEVVVPVASILLRSRRSELQLLFSSINQENGVKRLRCY